MIPLLLTYRNAVVITINQNLYFSKAFSTGLSIATLLSVRIPLRGRVSSLYDSYNITIVGKSGNQFVGMNQIRFDLN